MLGSGIDGSQITFCLEFRSIKKTNNGQTDRRTDKQTLIQSCLFKSRMWSANSCVKRPGAGVSDDDYMYVGLTLNSCRHQKYSVCLCVCRSVCVFSFSLLLYIFCLEEVRMFYDQIQRLQHRFHLKKEQGKDFYERKELQPQTMTKRTTKTTTKTATQTSDRVNKKKRQRFIAGVG